MRKILGGLSEFRAFLWKLDGVSIDEYWGVLMSRSGSAADDFPLTALSAFESGTNSTSRRAWILTIMANVASEGWLSIAAVK